jgi:hypothetical protein
MNGAAPATAFTEPYEIPTVLTKLQKWGDYEA